MSMFPLHLQQPRVKPGLLELTPEQWHGWLADRGQPPLRARQMVSWLLMRRATSFEQMTDLPADLRQALAEEFVPLRTSIAHRRIARDGTNKLLIQLHDGQQIECVLLQEGPRRTVCISTQVGCGMGCVFCASGLEGVTRNLTSAEILEQLIHARNLLPEQEKISHVVVMGMGEPLANLDALLPALDIATGPSTRKSPGLDISARHVTISTVGLPGRMRQLADHLRGPERASSGKAYHLAVSLHAPNDALRSGIVAAHDKIGLKAILEAADYFYATTRRQVTYEYVLLHNVNDRRSHALELARLLQGRQAHINLIPFNDVVGLPYRQPTQNAVSEFVTILRRSGLSVKVRKRKGADIDAACGQLRRALSQQSREAHLADDQVQGQGADQPELPSGLREVPGGAEVS